MIIILKNGTLCDVYILDTNGLIVANCKFVPNSFHSQQCRHVDIYLQIPRYLIVDYFRLNSSSLTADSNTYNVIRQSICTQLVLNTDN